MFNTRRYIISIPATMGQSRLMREKASWNSSRKPPTMIYGTSVVTFVMCFCIVGGAHGWESRKSGGRFSRHPCEAQASRVCHWPCGSLLQRAFEKVCSLCWSPCLWKGCSWLFICFMTGLHHYCFMENMGCGRTGEIINHRFHEPGNGWQESVIHKLYEFRSYTRGCAC